VGDNHRCGIGGAGERRMGIAILTAMRWRGGGVAKSRQRWFRRVVAPAIGLLAWLCLITSPASAEVSVIAASAGPPLAAPEVAAATPSGNLMGVGSDGGEGVWFSEDTTSHETAYMVHYSPSQSGLKRIAIEPASPFDEVVQGIAPGANGTEWFASFYDNQVSRITTRGKRKIKTLPPGSEPQDVVVDQHGSVWFTARGGGCHLGHLSPAGKLLRVYPLGGDCYALTVGPDGNIWVAEYTANEVVEVSATTGTVLASYSVPLPDGIATLGNDVYVTETEPGVVAKIEPSGDVTEYVLPAGRKLEWMTAGPDDAVWFTETEGPVAGSEGIGRLTPNGELSEVAVPSGGPGGIAATTDAIYFTESEPNAGIMRIPLSNFVAPEPTYVALGDSYSSGEGNPPYEPASDDPSTFDSCHRSESAYGPELDRALALGAMTFKACSGAVTDDLFNANDNNPTEPGQMDWLNSNIKTVTLTIGGDDAGFPNVLEHCVAGPRLSESGWPYWVGFGCSNNPLLRTDTANRLKALAGTGSATTLLVGSPIHPLTEVLDTIHTDAPNAKIVVGGYPQLFGSEEATYEDDPDAPGQRACRVGSVETILGPEYFWVGRRDALWLNAEGAKLDKTIKKAVGDAKKQGVPVMYAPPTPFDGHGLCDKGAPWFHTLELNSSDEVDPGSFHPNGTGQTDGFAPAFAAQLK
jgi:streptogramin lyase